MLLIVFVTLKYHILAFKEVAKLLISLLKQTYHKIWNTIAREEKYMYRTFYKKTPTPIHTRISTSHILP
jgi:hypothetical protein